MDLIQRATTEEVFVASRKEFWCTLLCAMAFALAVGMAIGAEWR